MYSPKIQSDLIPKLYRAAKSLNMPMTRLVHQLLTDGLARLEPTLETVNEPARPYRKTRKQKR